MFSLFMATVMTISAMPVAACVLHDMNLLKAGLGFLVMSALTVKDVFFLATPFGTEDVHVQVLASIATALASQDRRARIDDAADANGLFRVLKGLLAQKKSLHEPDSPDPDDGR